MYPPMINPNVFIMMSFIDSGLTLDQIRTQHWAQVDNAGLAFNIFYVCR